MVSWPFDPQNTYKFVISKFINMNLNNLPELVFLQSNLDFKEFLYSIVYENALKRIYFMNK